MSETDRIDDFAALLTEATPQPVWDPIVEVRDEMPESVRAVVRARAESLGNSDLVALLTPAVDQPPVRKRLKPGGRPTV